MEISDLTSGLALRKPVADPVRTAPSLPSTTPEPVAGNVGEVRAIDALRQELRVALDLRFSSNPSRTQPFLQGYVESSSAAGIRTEVLGQARSLVQSEPGNAPGLVDRFRNVVGETVANLRAALSGRGDIGDIDPVASGIDRGLGALANSVAGNRVASTEVLSVRSRVAAGSNIAIRTQEGDVVRFNLNNFRAVSADDAAVSDADGAASFTELRLRESSTLRVVVEGDLNDEELDAIRNVFDQASAIADAIFEGDYGAAFEAAEEFSVDAQELDTVRLRFRQRETLEGAYAREVVTTPAEPQAPASQPDVPPASPVRAPLEALEPIINRPAPVQDEVAAQVSEPEPAAEPDPAPAGDEALAVDDARAEAQQNVLTLVGQFLDSVRDGFNAALEDGSNGTYFFTDRFNLTLLRETLQVQAPAGQSEVAEGAGKLVDAVSAALDVEPPFATD